MLNQVIPIEEILFVFNSWTLMINSNKSLYLSPGDQVLLLDVKENLIGEAKLNHFLPSKNPEITPIAISVVSISKHMKDVRFIKNKL